MRKVSYEGVSIVTTTFNERENLPILISRIRKALSDIPHEIIVVDDSSPDGTYEVAKNLADKSICKEREGQTKGLLVGMSAASYPIVVTIDADLENPPELIPTLLSMLNDYDILVASRTKLPRISEKFASFILGKALGVSDFYSNFRIYKWDVIEVLKNISLAETFGGELLIRAWANGYHIGEYRYEPVYRRSNPRLGGVIKSNLRILYATIKLIFLYLRYKLKL